MRTCANDAANRFPFAGRCCVCTLPLPCKELSHNYQNELVLSGRCAPHLVDGPLVCEDADTSYHSRYLEINLCKVLTQVGAPISHVHQRSVATQQTKRSCPGQFQNAQHSSVATSSVSRPLPGRREIFFDDTADAQQATEHQDVQRTASRPENEGLLRPVPLRVSVKKSFGGESCRLRVPRSKRRYQEALLEPVQLHSPHSSTEAHRNRLLADAGFSAVRSFALSPAFAKEQARDQCDLLSAGCLPERYRRDKDFLTEVTRLSFFR